MSSAVDDEDIIEVLSESDDVELTTTAVANELPISRGYTRTRLQRLVEDDRVERRREGNSIVWWLPERADDAESDEAVADSETEAADEESADADEDADEAADEEDDGPQSVEVEAVANDEGDDEDGDDEDGDDEDGDDEDGVEDPADAADEDGEEDPADVADEDGEEADVADEKPATATGSESATAAGESDETDESAGPAERPTVRVREYDAPASRGGPDSLAKLLGVAALVLVVFALLRRLRRR